MLYRRRILLVEDSFTQAARLKGLVAADDLEIVHVQTAEAALERLQEGRTDLVLLDYHLPGMNGGEFCRQIRMNVNTRAIPVLMLTVEEGDAAQLRSLESGADDYLSKSTDPDVLRVRIRSLLRRSGGPDQILDEEKSFARARILAVDDSPTYTYFLARQLKEERYDVETANDPLDALHRLQTNSYDCVLVDFQMPGIDGAEVCRRIRTMRRDWDPELVLVMLTSHEDKERMTMCFEAGADDYISKSTDVTVTLARIRALLRRKFLVDENRRILREMKDKELDAARARSEREAAELRATMADRLAVANRELEQFAYSAAHDLQEPLRSIGVYVQLLQSRYGPSLDETATQYMNYTVDGVARMNRLIQDLLAYAKAGSAEERPVEPVNFNVVLDRALESLALSLEESNAEVIRGELPTLRVEETKIQQVFQNLIGNAVKYRRDGAPLRIEISANKQSGEWVFAVEDNGIGIDPQYVESVFKPFKRLGGVKSEGTGLGLAICQRTIEHHGGRIWVEATPGSGSKFSFALPAQLETPVDHDNLRSSGAVT